MIISQIAITIFVIFAISRVILRYGERKISIAALAGWGFLWIATELIVWVPGATTGVAKILGIGRGADLLIYGSIVVIFYLIFRVYVKMEDIERQITEIVRKIALEKKKNK